MRPIITVAAALVLAAGAANAQGNGNGKNNDRGGGGQGGGQAAGAPANGGGDGGKDRGGGNANRGGGNAGGASMQGGGKNRDNGSDRGNGNGNGGARAEQGNSGDRGNRVVADDRGGGNAGRGNDKRGNGNAGRGNDSRMVVLDDRGRGRDRDVVIGDVVRVRSFSAIPSRGIVAGCPPGLAKKNPPCVPPGQVRGRYHTYDRPDFWGLRLTDGRYRYDDGYLVRLGQDGRIGGYVPLLGGALRIGNAWPAFYQPVALPTYYESYYGLGQYQSYRYADNVIYRVDPETAAITSIAALLTGDDFAVGRPMPVGYDVYNVPYSYRTQYSDTPDALYRYSDGYVYQVDPETRLVAAAIELLAS